jgi:hypothetical protein
MTCIDCQIGNECIVRHGNGVGRLEGASSPQRSHGDKKFQCSKVTTPRVSQTFPQPCLNVTIGQFCVEPILIMDFVRRRCHHPPLIVLLFAFLRACSVFYITQFTF